VPVPVAGYRHRVDREHLAAGGPQAGDQQTAAGLDGHRDRFLGTVAGIGEHLQQRGEPGRVVADPALGDPLAVGVD